MFENEILKPCEKIKAIRSKYKLTQQELAGKDISRQFVGYIENGQSDLSEENAKIIEKNLNAIFEKLGIENPNISAELLMETEAKQINKIVAKFNEDLTYAKKANNFSSYTKIQEEIKKIYDKYYSKNNIIDFLGIIKILCESTLYIGRWEEAKDYILVGIDKSNYFGQYNDLLIFYSWLTVVGIGLREYKGIIPVYKHALELYEKNKLDDKETFTKLTINAALACRYLEKDNECVEYLARVQYLTDEPKNLFKIYNLMGKSLLVLKKYDEAKEQLLKALEFAKNTSTNNVNDLSIVLENLSMLYLETNMINDATKYIGRIEQVIDSTTNDYQKARNLYYLTIIEIMKGDKKGKVKSLCSKVINLAAKLKDKLLLYRTAYEVCKYLIIIDDIDGLEKLADTIYNVSTEDSMIYERIPNVLHTIAEYFDELNNDELPIEECKKYEAKRKKVAKYAYMLERKICHSESFEI